MRSVKGLTFTEKALVSRLDAVEQAIRDRTPYLERLRKDFQSADLEMMRLVSEAQELRESLKLLGVPS